MIGLELEGLRGETTLRTRDFTGRDAALRRVDKWLDRDGPRTLLLTGDMGAGKSAIAGRLVEIALGEASAPPGLPRLGPRCVAAAHFCSGRRSESLDPTACARDLAQQLAGTVPHFDAALAQTLSGLSLRPVSVNIQMQAGRAERMTAVENLTLNLGPIAPGDAFSRFLVEPLKTLVAGIGSSLGDDRILLVVDAVDEALRRASDGSGIVEMLAASEGLPDRVRLLLTGRRGVAGLESAFPEAERLDLSSDIELAAEGRRDAGVFALHGLRRALAERGLAEPADLSVHADRLVTRANANFQYIRFAVDAIATGQQTVDDLQRVPPGLDGLYHATLTRILAVSGQDWPGDYAPILGVLAAAREPLPAVHLRGATGLTVARFDRTTGDLRQFVRNVQPDGGLEPEYQLWHESVVEFLRRPLLSLPQPAAAVRQRAASPPAAEGIANPFILASAEGHDQLAEWLRQGWSLGWSERPDEPAERYAMRNMAAHLIGAMEGAAPLERHRRTAELLSVLTDSAYQDTHLACLNDPARLARDALDAMRCASHDRHPEAPIGLIRFAQETRRLRLRLADPDPIFGLARGGDPGAAARRLDLFQLDPAWRCVALCSLALAAGTRAGPSSQDLLHSVVQSVSRLGLSDEPPGQLVVATEAALAGYPNPLPPLRIAAPSRQQAQEIVATYGAGGVNISGLPAFQGSSDAQPVYAAEEHAPLLVAYAVADPVGGLNLIVEYIRILGANPYAVYRNRSLYILLGYIVRHPMPQLVTEAVAAIVGTVLAGPLVFEEALPLAALGLLARQDSLAEITFDAKAAAIRDAAKAEKNKNNREGDSWSAILRRLAALAETRAFAQDRTAEAGDLIVEALGLPRGYAGYRAPACLALAEAVRIVRRKGDDDTVDTALNGALEASHNIQDSDFCLITTGRVAAAISRWWNRPYGGLSAAQAGGGGDLQGGMDFLRLAELLRDSPGRPEFGSVHHVGEAFKHRDTRPEARQIEDDILAARTAAAIARIFHCHPDDLRRLNPGLPPDDTLIELGTAISVPDAGMPPLIAARFAADLLFAPPGPQRLMAMQSLVPIAAGDPTAADTVLARLLLAAVPAGSLNAAWRLLLESIAAELDERQRAIDTAGRAYEFLDIPP